MSTAAPAAHALAEALRAARRTLEARRDRAPDHAMWQAPALPALALMRIPAMLAGLEQAPAPLTENALQRLVPDGQLFSLHATLAYTAEALGEPVEDEARRRIAAAFTAREDAVERPAAASSAGSRDRLDALLDVAIAKSPGEVLAELAAAPRLPMAPSRLHRQVGPRR